MRRSVSALKALVSAEQTLARVAPDHESRVWHLGRSSAFADALALLGAVPFPTAGATHDAAAAPPENAAAARRSA